MTDQQHRCQSAQEAVLERWPLPVERIELASEFGTTVVTACGPRDGEPLVLQHGGSTTSAVWFANAAGLGRTRRLYAVDRIGEAGFSRPGPRPLRTPADLVEWLDGVFDGLSLSAPDLLGHSYGGAIALSYALNRPQRVGRLVLLDPTQCFAGFRAGYLLHALPMLLRPTAARAQRFLAWETGGLELDPAWVELYGRAAEFPRGRFVVPHRPSPPQLANCQTPTLILLAAQSRAHDSRTVQTAAARLLPHAETALLPPALPGRTAGQPADRGVPGQASPVESGVSRSRKRRKSPELTQTPTTRQTIVSPRSAGGRRLKDGTR